MLVRTRSAQLFRLIGALGLLLAIAGCYKENKPPEPPAYVPEVVPLPSPPAGFEAMPEPPDNPATPEKAALGRQLFFDKRLSVDGSRSCYSCHVNEHGLTDGLPTAIGAGGKKLPRSSPTLWNIGYHKELYWDGRSGSLEKQGMAAWQGANMGAKDHENEIVAKLNAVPGYKAQFQKVFGTDVTAENMMKAISAYERTFFFCGDTAFDKFQQGDQSAISEEAKRGWELFRGKAGCGTCHAGILFTDLQYHNVGVGMDAKEPDVGRKKPSNEDKDTGAFKTSTLRNITKTAPYFHNGSAATLDDVLDIVLAGGKANKWLDKKNLKPVKLTAAQRSDLLAFLKTLECHGELKEPKLP